MPPEPNPPPQLKEWFDAARYRAIAQELTDIAPKFRSDDFMQSVLDGLEDRSLMERVHQCAVAVDAALPGTYQQKVRVLQKLAPRIDHEFVTIFLGDFVATFGLDDFDFSMDALRFFTVFGSAEFAVRPFIVADQKRALQKLHEWTADPEEKVRRLREAFNTGYASAQAAFPACSEASRQEAAHAAARGKRLVERLAP